MEEAQIEKLESIHQRSKGNGDNIINILQEMQSEFGYIQEDSVAWFAARTNIPAATFYGVITFYSQFHLTPRGKNVVTVCCGTVCHVKGAPRIISKMRENLQLKGDNCTTKDKLFTLETVNCVGACSIAPVVMVGGKVFGKQGPEKMVKNLQPYKE